MSTQRAFGWPSAGSTLDPAPFDIPLPTPGPGQVRVKVATSALNPADLRVSSGEFVGRFLHAQTTPLITGYDFAGVVDETGPGARFQPGDAVFGFLPYNGSNRQGAFASYVLATEGEIARRPATCTEETAVALATPGVTALQCLRDLGALRADGHALVIGAAGGVGSLAVGIAKRLGARVTAVCSTYAVDFVKDLGADEVVDRKTRDPLTLPGPFNVVFDAAAAHSYFAFRKQLAPGGAYVTTLPGPGVFLAKILAPLHGQRCAFIAVKSVPADLETLAHWAGDGMRVPVDSTFAVGELGAAITRFKKGAVRGRVVIRVT